MLFISNINSDFLAISVALIWACSALLMADIVKKMGTVNFNSIRIISVMVVMWFFAYFFANFDTIDNNHILSLLLSGFFGIFIGDILYFYGVAHLGPRRASILFSTSAAQTIILSWLFLNETLTITTIFGTGLVSIGVFIAIAYGKRKSSTHKWEQDPSKLSIAIIITTLAATFQSIGTLLARPALEAGAEPIAALTLRISCAGFGFIIARLLPLQFTKVKHKLNITKLEFTKVIFFAFLAMLVGNWLVLLALRDTKAGIVATYISLYPVFQLILLRFFTKEWPAPLAWLGAIISFIGTILIFIR